MVSPLVVATISLVVAVSGILTLARPQWADGLRDRIRGEVEGPPGLPLRLEGTFEVEFDRDETTNLWRLTPRCESGACDVEILYEGGEDFFEIWGYADGVYQTRETHPMYCDLGGGAILDEAFEVREDLRLWVTRGGRATARAFAGVRAEVGTPTPEAAQAGCGPWEAQESFRGTRVD